MIRRSRRVKIIATLGPASADRAVVANLFKAGADVFRINMSHASHEAMRERVAMIRSLEEEFDRPIGILVDLQGPKLRVGEFESGGVQLRKGDVFTLDANAKLGDATRVYLPHPEILGSVEPGHRVLIDDGKVLLRVAAVAPGRAETIVEVAGRVSNKKGVSLPDTTIPTSAMTEKDRADLAAALEEGIDWIALSFVQRPEDVIEVKKIAGDRALVMAKIEKPQAIQRLDDILAVSDAVMVARGDLGVEMPLEQVPGLQKTITRRARRLGKPVVIATQMLESMITTPVPTRAEVSDVATAVFEGADAVMLSAESASGPISDRGGDDDGPRRHDRRSRRASIRRSSPPSARRTTAAAATRSPRRRATSPRRCSRKSSAPGPRPARPACASPASGRSPSIIALTPVVAIARRLALAWGVHAVVTEDARDERDMADRACRHAYIDGFVGVGERVIVVCGVPFGKSGATNNLRITRVGPDGGAV